MEVTFMMTYCMGSNLHDLLCSDNIPSVLATLLPFIRSAIDPDTRGLLMSDLAVFRAQAEPAVVFNKKQQKLLSTDAYAALLTWMTSDSDLYNRISFVAHNSGLLHQKQRILSPFAQILLSVVSRGIHFTPFSRHTGDIQVLYQSSHLQGRLAMGRIIEIFVHRRITGANTYCDQVFALVKQFRLLALQDKKHDVFHRFKHLCISIVQTITIDPPEAIPMQDIVAHFAACPFDY
jgi:hypothetical protein